MPSSTDTPQKRHEDPLTPVSQSVAVFPPPVHTPITQIHGNHGAYSRRPSLIDTRANCSSSSSLYELNVSASNLAGVPVDHGADSFHLVSSSAMHYTSSEDESDSELDFDKLRSTRRSTEIFKNDWNEIMGTQSPTFNSDPKQNGTRARGEYLAQLRHIDSSTPIFKRLVSKNALKPQLKAFRRISSDLQHEMVNPLENEINHEKLVLLNLKDEESLMSSKYLDDATTRSESDQSCGITKFDIIKKANESWNQRKNAFMHRKSTASSSGNSSDAPLPERNVEDQGRLVRKRASFENDFEESSKRRAVSTSPISTGFFKKGSIKLITKASKDLEKMTLKNNE